jgi:hypothetical protein
LSRQSQSPWQSPGELNGVKYLKSHAQVLLDRTGTPDNLWLLAQDHLANVYDLSANRQLDWKYRKRCEGEVEPDLSHILMFYWFEPALFCEDNLNFTIFFRIVSKFYFPENTDRHGDFVGFSVNVRDTLTIKILKNDLVRVLHRSVFRSEADSIHRN